MPFWFDQNVLNVYLVSSWRSNTIYSINCLFSFAWTLSRSFSVFFVIQFHFQMYMKRKFHTNNHILDLHIVSHRFFSYLLYLFILIFLRILHDMVWTIACNYIYPLYVHANGQQANLWSIDWVGLRGCLLVLHSHLVGIFQLNILHSHTQCMSILSVTCSCRLYRSIAAELRYAWFSIRSAIVQSKID